MPDLERAQNTVPLGKSQPRPKGAAAKRSKRGHEPDTRSKIGRPVQRAAQGKGPGVANAAPGE